MYTFAAVVSVTRCLPMAPHMVFIEMQDFKKAGWGRNSQSYQKGSGYMYSSTKVLLIILQN